MAALDFVAGELDRLRAAGLLRAAEALIPAGTGEVDLTSNDYLGLARSIVSRETLFSLPAAPPGAGSSRLLDGTHPLHEALETALASWVSQPAALLFASGYAANVGLLQALAGPGDLVVSDALNHASIVDGCRLSRSAVAVTPHLDVQAVEDALRRPARRRFVVVESLYSMEGDSPDLRAYRELCDRYGAALLVDEAHALGVLGPRGAGLCAAVGVSPDVAVGTLGKAVGTSGAFVAASATLRLWLWNRARSFVYSTGTSPWLAALTLHHLARVQHADAPRAHLLSSAASLSAALRDSGLSVPSGAVHHLVPVLLGTPEAALGAVRQLASKGIRTRAIRPPTVPTGTARLRLSLTSALSAADVDRVREACLGLISSPP